MVSVLQRKLLRDVWQSLGLLTAVGSIIAIGITCFVGMRSAYLNLRESKDRYYRQTRMADFWIDMRKAPLAELDERLEMPGVGSWRTRITFRATVDLPDFPEPVNARVISLPEQRTPVINDIVLTSGGYFSDRRINEAIVNQAFAEAHGLRPGDSIDLVINNRQHEVWIVGTAISAEYAYVLDVGAVLPDSRRFGVFYVKRSYAEEVYDFEGAANQVVGMFSAAGRLRREAILRQLEHRLEEYGVIAAIPRSLQMSDQFLTNEIDGLGAFATVTPAMFLVTAALVLNIFLGRITRQQRTAVGTLKALGYDDGPIFLHFLSYGLIVGVAGGLAGNLLGYLSAWGLTTIYQMYFQIPELRSDFYPGTHLVGICVSVVFSLLGSLHSAREMLRLRPAEAMRPAPPRRGGAVWVERLQWLWHRLSANWRMVVRDLLRQRWRTATTAFSALTGSALLVVGLLMVEAQTFLINFQFERVLRSDLDVVFTSERGREAWDELRRAPGVRRVEPILELACTLENGPYRRLMSVTGLLPGAELTVPRDVRGTAINIPDTGIVLTRQLASLLRVRPGDLLDVRPVRGERRVQRARVASVSDSFIGLSAYASIYFASQLADEPFVMSGAQIQLERNDYQLAALYRELKETPGIETVQVRRENVKMLRETLLENQSVLITVLVLFSGVIFFGSILNASYVNLHERKREVASLRALGYTPGEIGSVFLREALLANVVGGLLGLPAGYGLLWLTAQSYNSEFLRLPVVWAGWVGVAAMASAVGFTLLAHAVIHRSITRMNIREELNVRE